MQLPLRSHPRWKTWSPPPCLGTMPSLWPCGEVCWSEADICFRSWGQNEPHPGADWLSEEHGKSYRSRGIKRVLKKVPNVKRDNTYSINILHVTIIMLFMCRYNYAYLHPNIFRLAKLSDGCLFHLSHRQCTQWQVPKRICYYQAPWPPRNERGVLWIFLLQQCCHGCQTSS